MASNAAKHGDNEVDANTRYEEAGRLERYILGWRQAAFAGFLIALFSVGNVILDLAKEEQYFLAGLVSLFLAPLGVAFTLLDVRSRAIYNNLAAAARGLEGQSAEGPYTYQHKRDTGEEKRPADDKLGWHTVTLWAEYLGYGAVLLFVSGFLFATWWWWTWPT